VTLINPPKNPRPFTFANVTIIPVGSTERGWECTLIVEPDGTTVPVVDDGLSRHEGRPCIDPHVGQHELLALLDRLETYGRIAALATGSAGRN
jgi:hypothetical protein